jgi:CHAT domain-containing protein
LFDCGAQAARLLNAPGELSHFLERGRAGSLLESIQARGELWTVLVPAPLRAAERKAVANEAQAVQGLQRATRSRRLRAVRAAKAVLDAARAEVEIVVARMEREAKAASSIVHARVDDLATIQERLASGQTMVLYTATTDTVMALVVRKKDARVVSLGSTAMLREARLALRVNDPEADPAKALERLRLLLVAPLGLGEKDRTVLVSPAGELGYLPFALLVGDRDVAYVPSGTVHGLLREFAGEGGTKVLALGDPTYAEARRLSPLPATRAEVEAVGDVQLLGARATRAALEEALAAEKRWRAVHFACHGLVDPEAPLRSALALTATPEDDGTLSCRDVFRLTVAADLVVLSACETGKGRIFKTEGIVGLTRAFLFAGAPRVICSLWKVDDEATQALMIKFYELWNPKGDASEQGVSAAAALRQAQAYVRGQAKWQHPYYWAAWVLWGLPE